KVEACVENILAGQEFTLKNDQGLPITIEAEPDILQQLVDLRNKGKLGCGTFSLRLTGNVENMKLMCTKFSPKGESPGEPKSQDAMDFTPDMVRQLTEELKKSFIDHRGSPKQHDKRMPMRLEER
ncbi:MAG TPA: hypothetical protein VLA99_08240, partial [Nitrospiraceae bacterium]|nr:hypothetical protein [Nitrospiraceae bacterium]